MAAEFVSMKCWMFIFPGAEDAETGIVSCISAEKQEELGNILELASIYLGQSLMFSNPYHIWDVQLTSLDLGAGLTRWRSSSEIGGHGRSFKVKV